MNSELSLWIKKICITIIIGIFCFIAYSIRDIFFIIIISGFLTIIINPLISLWERHKISIWITLILLLIIILLLWSVVIGTLIPIIVTYISDTIGSVTIWANTAEKIYLAEGIPGFHLHPYLEKIILFLFRWDNINHTLDIIKQNAGNIQSFLTSQISSLTSWGISIVSQVGWIIWEWVIIIISTFLMLLERGAIGSYILKIIPPDMQHYIENHYAQVQAIFTSWMKAMLILSASIFAVTYIGLFILELFGISTEKTFTLALIGGIMEFIPYAGPMLSFVPAVIIWLGISWQAALAITILYIMIQFIENNWLVPYVMSRSLDLSPFFVFIIMLIGATLGWILGIILALPIAAVVHMTIGEYQKTLIIKKKAVSQKKTKSLPVIQSP